MMTRIVRLRPARQAPTATQARRPEQPEAIAPRGRMRPPPWLPRTAHPHFRRLARLLAAEQRESPSHVDVVALAAHRMAQLEELERALEGGTTYETSTDRSGAPLVRARPEAAQRDEAMRHLHALLVELGLTPAAAHRMLRGKNRDAEEDENPFAEFA